VGSNTGSGPARAEYHASLGLSPVEADDDVVVYYHDLAPDLRADAQARTWQDQSMTPLEEPWPLATWPDVPTRVLTPPQWLIDWRPIAAGFMVRGETS
jgi:hypothetical protein